MSCKAYCAESIHTSLHLRGAREPDIVVNLARCKVQSSFCSARISLASRVMAAPFEKMPTTWMMREAVRIAGDAVEDAKSIPMCHALCELERLA